MANFMDRFYRPKKSKEADDEIEKQGDLLKGQAQELRLKMQAAQKALQEAMKKKDHRDA